MEENSQLAEGMKPLEAIRDGNGALQAVRFDHLTEVDGKWVSRGDEFKVGLRSLFIAAGTSPNTLYEQEHAGTFEIDGQFLLRFGPPARHTPSGLGQRAGRRGDTAGAGCGGCAGRTKRGELRVVRSRGECG